MIITTLLTLAVLVVVIIGVGAFATILLPLQQASAIITTFAKHNKCSDLITCTSDKKSSHHSTKDDSTPYNLPLPFP
jgi:CHASE3 domain sensor protein